MKKIALLAILLGGLLGGAAYAQDEQSTLPEGFYRKHMALPEGIRALLNENKAKEAVAEYEKFKKTAQADALDMLMLDAEVYGSASFIEPNANYGKLREEAVNKMVEQFPNDAEVILYTLPNDGNPDVSLKILNRAAEVDPEYLPTYLERFFIYKEKKMMKEACLDYVKLPEAVQVGLLDPDMDCSKEVEAANK